MTDIRNQIVLPPAQQIEELTRDVDELQQQVAMLFEVVNNMAGALIQHDQALNNLGQLVMVMRRGDNAGTESDTGSDRIEGAAVEGDREPGTGSPVSD